MADNPVDDAWRPGTARIAAALRRGEVIEHVLSRMRTEVMAPRMMDVVLSATAEAMGARGASVIAVTGDRAETLHETGEGAAEICDEAGRLIAGHDLRSETVCAVAGASPLLVASCLSRFGDLAGLALWRPSGGRAWDKDDQGVAAAVLSLVRLLLEHDRILQEMTNQIRTDPLTRLLNRRAFIEELPRHVDRLEREGLPGTLLLIDLDHFKRVNDQLGHEAGDELIGCLAEMLRNAVRPTDLVARMGGDEFAVWLNGADHLTAAERAEWLRVEAPRRFAAQIPGLVSPGLSIGIAARGPGSGEEAEALLRRADEAMYQVKRTGRGHWRVWLEEQS